MRISRFNARKVAYSGLFLALALIVSLVESALPPIIPVLPYAKVGLSNVVLLACFLLIGPVEGYIVLILRCFLSAVFAANLGSMIWSVPAALVSYTVMVLLYYTKFFSVAGLSVIGGMIHNFIQILVATFVVGASCFYYLPYMLLAGFLAGFVTGIVCHFIVISMKDRLKINNLKSEEYRREER